MIREFGKGAESAPAPERSLSPEKNYDGRNENLSSGSFHTAKDQDDKDGDNTLTIASGILAAVLIIGGGIYAYESMHHATAAQQVALKTPATNPMAADQAATPPAATPDNAAPAMTAPPQPAPAAPAPRRSPAVKAADDSAAPPPSTTASAEPAINVPMTLTPDTAPAPQQSAPAGQTAMQPLTAPNVSDQSGPSTPSMANNAAPGVNLPSSEPQAPAAQLPADQAQEPAAQ